MTNTQGNRGWAAVIATATLVMLAAAIAAPAQTFTTLLNFDYTDGDQSSAALVQAADGNLYGTTNGGGISGQGTIFKITPGGILTTLHTFCTTVGCTDGAVPPAGLILAADGYFYGTTSYGGPFGSGTVFKMAPSGAVATVYGFCPQNFCLDGSSPDAALVEGADGNFYGTTYGGGASSEGTIFKLTPGGKLTTLYNFCSQSGCTDGVRAVAALVQGSDGNFYGTTEYGGVNTACAGLGCGTVFKITPAGAFTTLYSFCSQSGCSDGELPIAGLVQGADGNFYGTTGRGTNKVKSSGTIFKMTPGGALTTLYSFPGVEQAGIWPGAALIQATDGNLYGTTSGGGSSGWGTIFEIAPAGSLTKLHDFDPSVGAYSPSAALVEATNGTFYGTTVGGEGAVFSLSLSPPLGPFVETIPTSGQAGTKLTILGSDLTGATSVTFNGTAANFTVSASGTAIKTTVPAGATTGPVQVVTPSGTLTGNVSFQVEP